MHAMSARHLAVLLLSSTLPAQAECAKCSSTGEVVCKRCVPELETAVTHCSVAASCRVCGGAGVSACASCRRGVRAATTERAKQAQAWLAERQKRLTHADLGVAPSLCATPTFELWFAPGGIEGCPERDPHRQMHLYADRLEALRQRAQRLLDLRIDPVPGERLPLVAILRQSADIERLGAELGVSEAQGLGVLDLDRVVGIVQHAPPLARGDAELHRLVLHAGAQLLLAHALRSVNAPAGNWAWLRTGLAHWLVADLGGGICDTLCILDRPQPPVRYFGGNWRLATRELLASGQLPELADWFATDVSDYDLARHALAFAFVDFLQTASAAPTTGTDSARARPLVALAQACRRGEAVEPALQAALGGAIATIDARFRAFVEANYPRR